MNVINWIRNLLFLSLGFIIIIAFSKFFEINFLDLFVNKKLEYINSSFLLDFIVLVALVLYSSIAVNNCAYAIPNKTITFFLLLFISFYICKVRCNWPPRFGLKWPCKFGLNWSPLFCSKNDCFSCANLYSNIINFRLCLYLFFCASIPPSIRGGEIDGSAGLK